jgi:hypothetical protein
MIVILGGCSTSTGQAPKPTAPVNSLSEEAAVRAVFDSGLTITSGLTYAVGVNPIFPDRSDVIDCTMTMSAGDYGSVSIPGKCATSAQVGRAGAWTVTFTESWDGRQFHAGHDPASGELSHSWSYEVAMHHNVSFLGDRGNVAPQLADVI